MQSLTQDKKFADKKFRQTRRNWQKFSPGENFRLYGTWYNIVTNGLKSQIRQTFRFSNFHNHNLHQILYLYKVHPYSFCWKGVTEWKRCRVHLVFNIILMLLLATILVSVPFCTTIPTYSFIWNNFYTCMYMCLIHATYNNSIVLIGRIYSCGVVAISQPPWPLRWPLAEHG